MERGARRCGRVWPLPHSVRFRLGRARIQSRRRDRGHHSVGRRQLPHPSVATTQLLPDQHGADRHARGPREPARGSVPGAHGVRCGRIAGDDQGNREPTRRLDLARWGDRGARRGVRLVEERCHAAPPGPATRARSGAGRHRSRDPRVKWQRWAIPASGVPVVALLAWGLTRDARTVPSPLPGKPAPAFALQTLSGDSLRLGDLSGEVVLLNFWASWCLACRAEHQVLLEAQQQYRKQGLRIIGVVYQDTRDNAKAWLSARGGDWPNVLDVGSHTAIQYGLFGVPEAFC